jgi:hypothetical protein
MLILVVLLVIVLFGGGYGWHSGYLGGPQFGGGLGLLLVVVISSCFVLR